MAQKTSVYLPDQAIKALRRMADKRGTSMADVLRHAISTEDYLDKAAEKGKEILVKDNTGIKQLVRL